MPCKYFYQDKIRTLSATKTGANNSLDRSSNSPENLAPGIVQKSGLIVQTPSYNSLDPYSYNNPDMFQ